MSTKHLFDGGYGNTAVSPQSTRTGQHTLFHYVGGKGLLAPTLAGIIQDTAARYSLSHYCEPFGASARVMFWLQSGVFTHYHYNEIDQDIVNFFKVLGDPYRLYELLHLLHQLGVGNEVFMRAKKALSSREAPLTLIESAAYAYISIMQSRAAGRKAFDKEYTRNFKKVEKYYRHVQALESFHPFLSGVKVTCGEAQGVLQEMLYDSFALVYLDPPYSPDSQMSYNRSYTVNLSAKQHEDLARLLVQTRSKVVLSGYDNPQYQYLTEYGAFRKVFLRNIPVSSSGAARKRADEYIWVNFDIPQELLDNVGVPESPWP